jgi:hypothetical protein
VIATAKDGCQPLAVPEEHRQSGHLTRDTLLA